MEDIDDLNRMLNMIKSGIYTVVISSIEIVSQYAGLATNSVTLQSPKGEKKPVLPTSCQYGLLLSFSPLEQGKMVNSGGAGIDGGGGNRLPTSYVSDR